MAMVAMQTYKIFYKTIYIHPILAMQISKISNKIMYSKKKGRKWIHATAVATIFVPSCH